MAIHTRQSLCSLAAVGLILAGCQKKSEPDANAPVAATGQAPVNKAAVGRAEVILAGVGSAPVAGHMTLTALADGAGVQFTGELTGLTPGAHGIHVHEVGSCDSPDGMSAGGHFNPSAAPHGQLDAADSHVGDLGNVVADAAGTAKLHLIKAAARLTGPATLVGRSIIVHQDADDLKSQPAGKSGARVACGVIRGL
jgi:Cu-Zn family superoxide dismutase